MHDCTAKKITANEVVQFFILGLYIIDRKPHRVSTGSRLSSFDVITARLRTRIKTFDIH